MTTEKLILGGVFRYFDYNELFKITAITGNSISAVALNTDKPKTLSIKPNDVIQIPLSHYRIEQLGFIEYDLHIYMLPNNETMVPNYDFIIRYNDGLFYIGDRIIRNIMHLQALTRFYIDVELNTDLLI